MKINFVLFLLLLSASASADCTRHEVSILADRPIAGQSQVVQFTVETGGDKTSYKVRDKSGAIQLLAMAAVAQDAAPGKLANMQPAFEESLKKLIAFSTESQPGHLPTAAEMKRNAKIHEKAQALLAQVSKQENLSKENIKTFMKEIYPELSTLKVTQAQWKKSWSPEAEASLGSFGPLGATLQGAVQERTSGGAQECWTFEGSGGSFPVTRSSGGNSGSGNGSR